MRDYDYCGSGGGHQALTCWGHLQGRTWRSADMQTISQAPATSAGLLRCHLSMPQEDRLRAGLINAD